MMRIALVAVLLAGLPTLRAQDMPLSQVLIDGEGWTRASESSFRFPAKLEGSAPGIDQPTCRVVSPDGGTVFVGTQSGRYVWAFRSDKDGSLSAGQPYCSLRVAPGQKSTRVDALTVDTAGRIYAATPIGVQIFDPTGRLCGVLTHPSNGPLVSLAFGGSDGRTLFVATATSVFARKVKSQGVTHVPK